MDNFGCDWFYRVIFASCMPMSTFYEITFSKFISHQGTFDSSKFYSEQQLVAKQRCSFERTFITITSGISLLGYYHLTFVTKLKLFLFPPLNSWPLAFIGKFIPVPTTPLSSIFKDVLYKVVLKV